MRNLLFLAAPIVATAVALYVYLLSGRYETTDNAYLQRPLIAISSEVSGQIVSVDVKENQAVAAGQILFHIAPMPSRDGTAEQAVRAPQDGVVTKTNQLQVGSFALAMRPLFMLVGNRSWIEANFKESQLRYMCIGQSAELSVDALPDLELRGRLVSFSPGTGNSFAVLPPENATGNWVKVVQRLPVQFAITGGTRKMVLPAGLSLKVTVKTDRGRNCVQSMGTRSRRIPR
ncbi:HlyD family efflux transporter periplasmic adaptor subunit [Sphingobium sp. HWE2-09]|uniref:HlyD family efflux transporter periplasmic adaptor subunit n=1 Tax=Sphingobium sp. HWE2-09 TaxID=3108390 RepID=UPI002DC17DAE|nr:HlyD family efflux transporter periplasmic adaptor subunit [Sphingobium sp. HWE2-09]